MADYTIENSGTQCRVVLGGNLTAALVPKLQAALQQELARGVGQVVFDLSQVSALDASGIGLLIATYNSLGGSQGKLNVINVSLDILQLMQGLRLVHRFSVTRRPTHLVNHG